MKYVLPGLLTSGLFLLTISFLAGQQPPKTGPATEKRFPPLKLPPGLKATLFACDPLIEYPSVIAAGPRPGALFVAVDYMTGLGTDGKVKSEIRLVEDTDGDGYADKATVVAGGFNSIQGMVYHHDTLYVMHAPYLTAVRGKVKTNLLAGLGLPPEQNSSRLHCANGIVVGHDGWLYLAMGDNGVNVPRPEGDRLIHNGGCILRCRPDGRDLHIFSTGLRNIYDIALDAELNVFTRDNENDGGTYMIRVCHCFHGSDHGYPYHYEDRKDEAMPPIGDFGLGSSAGGVCYLETHLPPEYRGNLFFCEWGKSVVRYPLQRAGSGFAPVKEIEFASGDSKDTYPFKPTDIVVQSDGTLMVSDYADGQRPKRGRGRIYHIYDPGAEKKQEMPVVGSFEAWIPLLDSPSHGARYVMQKFLEESSDFDAKKIFEAIRTRPRFGEVSLGPSGRMHGIWALAIGHEKFKSIAKPQINEVASLRDVALLDPEAGVRAQAIRAIADLTDPILVKHKLDAGRGDAKIAEQLAALGKKQDPRVMLEIVIALGRFRWADAPGWLRDNLGTPDAALAHAAQQTLRRCDNWPEVVKLLDEPNEAPIRKIAVRAIAERYEPVVVDALIARLASDKDANHRREYADALTRVYKKPGPWKYWGYRPGPRPANPETWEKTEAIEKALDQAMKDRERAVRVAALKRMQREKVPVRLATLTGWLKDEHQAENAAVILAALAELPPAEIRQPLAELVRDRQHTAANRLTALALSLKGAGDSVGRDLLALAHDLEDGPVLAEVFRRLAKIPAAAPATLFAAKMASANADVRAAAVEALGEMRATGHDKAVLAAMQDADVRVRRAAAASAGKLKLTAAKERLLKLAGETDAGMRLACLEALRLLKEPRVVPLAVAALDEPALQTTALECLAELGGPAQIKAVVAFAKRNPSGECVVSAIRLLHRWHGQDDCAAIHGATGILVRWSEDGDKSKYHFAAGAESRFRLDVKEPKTLWCDVLVANETPVEFLASSRGSLVVWLNGKRVHQRMQPGKFQLDAERFAGTLVTGTNRIRVDAGTQDGFVEFHLHFRRKSSKAQHEKLTQAALSRAGSPVRGRKLFFDAEKSQCIKCHRIAAEGERIGPELTGVGSRFSRIYIVESILEPSRTIAPSFGTLALALKNGKVLSGIKVAETDTTLTLADNQGQKHVLAKADIDEQRPSPVSTMPEGLEQRLTEEEFVDLIAFLASQKEAR